MAEFGGWEMPISYPGGTVGEHMNTRTNVCVFDVSHLGSVRMDAPDSFDIIQRTLSNDLAKISPGRAQYTHLLDDATGSVLDDIIVWWIEDHCFDIMPNASNTQRVMSALPGKDVTDQRAVIAVQGPKTRQLLAVVLPQCESLPHFGVATTIYEDHRIFVAGTGYTGEDGVEISVPNKAAKALWSRLIAAGASPAGLGARDTLRLEAGLPLHGHELGQGITPYHVNMGWVVSMSKPDFKGKEALQYLLQKGPERKLVGIRGLSRQPLRENLAILDGSSQIGVTTSGNYSPVLGVGIALGFVDPSVDPGQEVQLEYRGRLVPAEITKIPFVKKNYKK